MDAIRPGSSVLVLASSEDAAVAARLALEEHGVVVAKRYSPKVRAVICVPCKDALQGPQLRQLSTYASKVGNVVNYIEVADAPASVSSSSSRSSAQNRRNAPAMQSEKRRAVWRRTCSGATWDRIERAMEQRMYLVEQSRISDEYDAGLARQYTVLGSTGNVYTVQIGSLISCNCPDALKGNVCKHQLFIFLRVLRIDQTSEMIYQRGLLPSEREKLFAKRLSRSAVASSSVREAYAEATGKSPKKRQKIDNDDGPSHRGSEDDDCAICYEALGKEILTVCGACRNAVHEECFLQWSRAKGRDITCPTCREPWAALSRKSRSSSGPIASDGYLNFGVEAGLPSERDESSYFSYWD